MEYELMNTEQIYEEALLQHNMEYELINTEQIYENYRGKVVLSLKQCLGTINSNFSNTKRKHHFIIFMRKNMTVPHPVPCNIKRQSNPSYCVRIAYNNVFLSFLPRLNINN